MYLTCILAILLYVSLCFYVIVEYEARTSGLPSHARLRRANSDCRAAAGLSKEGGFWVSSLSGFLGYRRFRVLGVLRFRTYGL